MDKWLGIVGIGEDGLDGLAPRARALVDGAEILGGGDRHLAMVADDGRPRIRWRRPPESFVAEIQQHRGRPVCVLATGDPMCFGIGVTLARHVPIAEMTIIPAPSAFSLACARLGWPRAEVRTLTLHGRPSSVVNRVLHPGARVLILSNDGETPARIATLLRARGFGSSAIWVFEHMGGARERVIEATAETWDAGRVADFNTLAIDCVATADADPRSPAPGLADDAYESDGQLTKREVRSATLAALAPMPGQLLWDLGAGCGSIGIEWMRAAPGARAIAIEVEPARAAMIERNAESLGVPGLVVVTGEAPVACDDLEAPDAVFIGGGGADPAVLDVGWARLAPGGRLVANAVTVEGEAGLIAWRARHGGALTRIAVSRAEPMGGFTGWRALAPVTQLAARKR
jgi:precorrin-6Y C5,15-methyltransferase (decarboxylating)